MGIVVQHHFESHRIPIPNMEGSHKSKVILDKDLESVIGPIFRNPQRNKNKHILPPLHPDGNQ